MLAASERVWKMDDILETISPLIRGKMIIRKLNSPNQVFCPRSFSKTLSDQSRAQLADRKISLLLPRNSYLI